MGQELDKKKELFYIAILEEIRMNDSERFSKMTKWQLKLVVNHSALLIQFIALMMNKCFIYN